MFLRRSVWLAQVCGVATLAVLGVAQASKQSFEIAAGEARMALREFGQQAGVQLLFDYAAVKGMETKKLAGEFEVEEGLKKLLEGTGLAVERVNERTLAVKDAVQVGSVDQAGDAIRIAHGESSTASPTEVRNGVGADRESANDGVEEIIVTAQKRVERLQDVPVPVSVIRADILAASNLMRVQDYYTKLPGLSLIGNNKPAIRGIAIDGISTTVGTVIDDVPYGDASTLGIAGRIPDIDPGDLQRIEVLRGPQGTLYGSSSIGGLFKFVTIDPSTERLSGRVQAGTSSVENGDGLGHHVRGAINIPLGDTLAVRASGFTRHDPGYIDDPVRNIDGVNKAKADGGRISALWHPSELFSAKLSGLFQNSKASASSSVDLRLNNLQYSVLPGTGGYDQKARLFSAVIEAKLGRAELTMLTGYNDNSIDLAVDFTPFFAGATLDRFGVSGALDTQEITSKRFTQEVRLSVPLGEKVNWLVGGIYDDTKTDFFERLLAVNASTGAPVVGEWVNIINPNTSTEYAVFTNLTYAFTNRFDVQFGVRGSGNRKVSDQVFTGVYVPQFVGVPSPLVRPQVRSDDKAFTYLVTPRFRLSEDLMIYARLASGFRAGGPNVGAGSVLHPSFDPDKTENYELGVKGNVLNDALSVDASVYSIDWKNIQVQLYDPNFNNYTDNAGNGRSRGIELSFASKPLRGLTIEASMAWNDATLTEDFPAATTVISTYGVSGDRLPFSSRFSGALSLNQEFPIASRVGAFVGASIGYISDRVGGFINSPERTEFPSYARTNLTGGVAYQDWTATVFVNNATDRRGILSGGEGASPTVFEYIQPRTIGLSLARTF